MKKLMFTAAVAAAGGLMAIESANTVGFTTADVPKGEFGQLAGQARLRLLHLDPGAGQAPSRPHPARHGARPLAQAGESLRRRAQASALHGLEPPCRALGGRRHRRQDSGRLLVALLAGQAGTLAFRPSRHMLDGRLALRAEAGARTVKRMAENRVESSRRRASAG